MRRNYLVFFLVLSLCQGFWHDGRSHLPRLANQEGRVIREVQPIGQVLCPPKTNQCFAQTLGSKAPALYPPWSHRLKNPRQQSVKWLFTARGQNRRSVDAVHPSEWGLSVLRYPRSDG